MKNAIERMLISDFSNLLFHNFSPFNIFRLSAYKKIAKFSSRSHSFIVFFLKFSWGSSVVEKPN